MGLKALHKLLDVGTCGLEPWLALLAKTPQSVTQVISTQRCRGTQHCVVLRTDAGASGWEWDRIPRARRQKDDEYFSEDEAMTLSVTQGTTLGLQDARHIPQNDGFQARRVLQNPTGRPTFVGSQLSVELQKAPVR